MMITSAANMAIDQSGYAWMKNSCPSARSWMKQKSSLTDPCCPPIQATPPSSPQGADLAMRTGPSAARTEDGHQLLPLEASARSPLTLEGGLESSTRPWELGRAAVPSAALSLGERGSSWRRLAKADRPACRARPAVRESGEAARASRSRSLRAFLRLPRYLLAGR